MDAPIVLRMPISFVRCSEVKAASPNSPRHATKIAMTNAALNICPVPPYRVTTGQAPVCHRGMQLSRDPEGFELSHATL